MINPYGVRGWVGVELAMLKIFVKFKNYSTNDGTHMHAHDIHVHGTPTQYFSSWFFAASLQLCTLLLQRSQTHGRQNRRH